MLRRETRRSRLVCLSTMKQRRSRGSIPRRGTMKKNEPYTFVGREQRPIVILGIDPGLAFLGLAAVAGIPGTRSITEARIFRSVPSAKKLSVAKADDRFRRARELAAFASAAVAEIRPDLVAIEAMSWPRNQTAVVSIALSWGVLAAALVGLPVVQAQPRVWRRYHDASGSETAAHKFIDRSERGAAQLREFKSADRPHVYDAAGVALWATTTDEYLAIMRGRFA